MILNKYIFIFGIFFFQIVYAASFNCSDATTALKKSICSNKKLKKHENLLEQTSIIDDNSSKITYATTCKKIKNDFIESIINVGPRRQNLFNEINHKSANLHPYKKTTEHGLVPNDRNKFTFLTSQTMKLNGKGKFLVNLEHINGWRSPSTKETYLVDIKKLKEIRKIISSDIKSKNKLYKAIKDVLKNNRINHNGFTIAYYQPEIGDILINIQCDKSKFYYGEGEYCEHVESVNIFTLNTSQKINKICNIQNFEQESTFEILNRKYKKTLSYNDKISIVKKILAQTNKEGKKELILNILNDKDSKVRSYVYEHSNWNHWGMTHNEATIILLKVCGNDKDSQVVEKAYFNLDPVFFHNGSQGCSNLNTIKDDINNYPMTKKEKEKTLKYLEDDILAKCKKWGHI